MADPIAGKRASNRRMRANLLRAIGPLLLLYIFWRFDLSAIVDHILSADPLWLLAAIILIWPWYLVRSLKWGAMNRHLGIDLPLGRMTFATAATDYLATLSPGKMGELVKLAYFPQTPMGPLMTSQIVDRITEVTGRLLMGALSVVAIWAYGGIDDATAIWLFLLSGGALMVAIFLLASSTVRRLVKRLVAAFRSKVTVGARGEGIGETVEGALRSAASFGVVPHFVAVVWTTVSVVVNFAAVWAVAIGGGLDAPAVYLFAVMNVVNLVNILPITVMGVGTRDLIFVAALAPLGVSAEQVIGFSTLLITVRLLEMPPSYLLWMWRPPTGVPSFSSPQNGVSER